MIIIGSMQESMLIRVTHEQANFGKAAGDKRRRVGEAFGRFFKAKIPTSTITRVRPRS